MENKIAGSPEAQDPEEENGTPQAPPREIDKYLKYVIFIVIIGLIYVWNSHYAERQLKREDDLKKEINEAKAEYRTIQARLSSGTRKSVISEKVDTLGLKVLDIPPYRLEKKSER